MNGQHRAFGHDIQLAIGHDGCDLDNSVIRGIQPGHLQINPDQVIGIFRHETTLPSQRLKYYTGYVARTLFDIQRVKRLSQPSYYTLLYELPKLSSSTQGLEAKKSPRTSR